MIQKYTPKFHTCCLCIMLLVLTGCGLNQVEVASSPDAAAPDIIFVTPTPTVDIVASNTHTVLITEQPLVDTNSTCSSIFVAHDLDHITTPTSQPVRMFDSNGSGLAINDLDNDGYLDLVLANLKGDNTIFWNEGNLSFRSEALPYGDARAVSIVDVDGDGRQDIVFTQRSGSLLYWRNDGEGFSQTPLPGVTNYAYTMAWGDLDQDGDLDLVTGSYDAELSQELGNTFLFSDRGGVYYYENQDGHFKATQLAEEAQALAIYLIDLNNDSQLDILVGNDFGTPDYAWLQQPTGWQAIQPFAETTHSTMSFEAGDINNNGQFEFFATDMKPYTTDSQILAAWEPVMASMSHPPEGDPQIMENVLQVPISSNAFENRAIAAGLSATGWSWSGKFGDLDNDGFLDAYIVNGMIATELFGDLPNAELVEQNQAFRNDGTGQFIPAPEWSLAATESGRGMSMADLDNDGDLDIVVNNLLSPAQIFENQLCGGSALAIDLVWPNSQNQRALGAHLILETSTGSYTRDVRSISGYLSGDPARVHFGLPANSQLNRLIIHWPDGATTSHTSLSADSLLTITREN